MCILTGHTYGRGEENRVLYIPHLVSVNERIRVDNIQIDNEDISEGVSKSFKDSTSDGGRRDRTSFVFRISIWNGYDSICRDRCRIYHSGDGTWRTAGCDKRNRQSGTCIITSISLDHTAILGDTIEKIAGEKAGIIKPGVPVFFDGSSKKAAEVIKAKASELGVSCREVTKNAYEIQEVHRKYIAFSRRSAYDKDVIFQVPMCGCYQAMNAELALERRNICSREKRYIWTGGRKHL